MYIGLPHRVAAITPSCRNRANPKSAILSLMSAGCGFLVLPSCANRMFCGLRSRWTMPLLFIATIAPAGRRRVREGHWSSCCADGYNCRQR